MKYSRKAKITVYPISSDAHTVAVRMTTIHGDTLGMQHYRKHPVVMPMGICSNDKSNQTMIGPSDFKTLLQAVESRIDVYLKYATVAWRFATKEEEDACRSRSW